MRHLGLRQCLAGCALIFAATSHATVYEITNTADAVVTVVAVDGDGSDGVWDETTRWDVTTSNAGGTCTLREALYASNYRIAVGACEAGGASDTIKLQEGKVYTLTEGELPIGNGEQIKFTEDTSVDPPVVTATDIEPLSNQVRFDLILDAFEEVEGKTLPVITAAGNSRLIHVYDGGAMSLTNLELTDGDAGADNGGLIYAMGPVIIAANVSMNQGMATNGGAMYLEEGSGVAFSAGGRFENNVASGVGAVIATSDTFNGSIIGYDFYMADNEAGTGAVDAGVIHMDGDPDSTVTLELANGMVVNNIGGVLNVISTDHVAVLANMTIAFNDGVALTLAQTQFDDPADAVTRDIILHSVMVGNSDGACAGSVLDGTATPADAAARLLFTITDDANCPVPEEQTLGTPVTNNPNTAQADIFLGMDRVPCAGTGAGGCALMTAEEIGGPYPGLLPNPTPAALAGDPMAPSLFDRASPETATVDQCESTDNRGNSRGGPAGRCDVGAVEFLRARAQPDEIDLISGQSVLADVLENDRNDTWVNCDLVPGFDFAAPATYSQCLDVITVPARGSVGIEIIRLNADGEELPSDADNSTVARFYPKIRYTPSDNFHGVDQLRYEVSKDAFFGGTDLGQNQSEITNLVAEPASGLTEKKSIGAQGGMMLAILALAGLIRRYRRPSKGVLALVFTVLSGPALAVDIEVNSLVDQFPPITNDGKCTLREALENAGGSGSPDCAYGGNSSDRILIPAGEIHLATTLIIEGGSVELVGKGVRDLDPADDEETLTRIIGNGTERLFEVEPPNPSSGHPGVTFRYLTLEDGVATGSGETGSGAVITTGGSVIFDRVVITNNHADASAGVAYVRSNAGNEKLVTFNRAYVYNNTAGVAGGVVSTTTQNNDNVKIAMIDSTFQGNESVTKGGVLDANINAGSVTVSNSTFVDNMSAQGAALDLTNIVVGATIMNSTFMNNAGGGLGIDLGDAPSEIQMANSIYFDSGAACTSGATVLHESHYNAFSGAACGATTESNNQVSLGSADLDAAVNDEDGVADDYTPPFLSMSDPENDAILVDMGNDEALVSGTGTPLRCRSVDLRGISRTSGGRCDLGAFEYQKITAGDDEGTNKNRPGRQVAVDILDNDLASDGAEIAYLDEVDPSLFLDNIFTFEHAEPNGADPVEYVGTGDFYQQDMGELTRFELINPANPDADGAVIDFVWLYYNEDRDGYDLRCGEPISQKIIDANPDLFEDGDVADECVVLFTPPTTTGFESSVCQSTDDNPLKMAFLYTFEDSNGVSVNPTDAATVVMTINDKAPALDSQSKMNQPGATVMFNLTASDPDDPDAEIDWSNYDISVSQAPSFAKKDENGNVVGAGLFIDNDNGVVTYIPQSNFNTFKDVFTLTIEDSNCGTVSQQTTFTVSYANDETSAGSGGSLGWAMLGGLILLLRRRVAA
ncbi:choice-of-anchor Q domain-containing protein [Alcanivorax sp.]|uniref:choice-of-anchor Q domain-containing protein n=1 Tax=Alcanivorax sp. TaxID=1872427 RepID=UPI002B278B08|nr:choice-of-anchor Q domain-containing protein [Alcanivorax sp.]